MPSLHEQLTTLVRNAFASAGYERTYGAVVPSNRPDLGQFQANGALAAAKQYGQNPRQIAQTVADQLSMLAVFQAVTVAGPGFINLTLADAFLADQTRAMATDPRYGCPNTITPQKVIVDYGGANVAKPMHVGHLRPAIIGESLKRIARFLGHTVIGDVHLGDWGLPMGMVIAELQQRQPTLPYFDATYSGSYPGRITGHPRPIWKKFIQPLADAPRKTPFLWKRRAKPPQNYRMGVPATAPSGGIS